VLLAAGVVALQMASNGRYGYFRDELYFLAASDHLDWGYVDFAPLSALVLRLSRLLFGESLHGLRLLPALAQGVEVLLTGLIARELGGKRFAIGLACLSVALAPVILGNATRFSMNPFEPLFWMGGVLALLLALNQERPQLLVWCGVLFGLGLENKHSTVFFLASLLVGLLGTSQRRLLRGKWLWMAAASVVVIALPNVLWQWARDFPTLVDLHNVRATHKNIELPPLPFLRQQIMMLNPASALVWIAGLGFLLFHGRGGRYRALGVTYVVFLSLMMGLHAKDYYLAPIYPMLFAAGGVLWEGLTETVPARWGRVLLSASVATLGVIALPLNIPVLPVEQVVPYMAALGMKVSRTETHHAGLLPQHFGDEFGWPEMVAAVAKVYDSLPPEERARTAILAGNYGEAGAIDFFGGRHGLPKSISAHQNYYYWGPRHYTGESLILLQWDSVSARRWCREVEEGPALAPRYGMSEEAYTILVCRGLKKPLAEAWDELKVWN